MKKVITKRTIVDWFYFLIYLTLMTTGYKYLFKNYDISFGQFSNIILYSAIASVFIHLLQRKTLAKLNKSKE